MRKFLFSAATLLAVNLSAQAIDNYGVKAGLNITSISLKVVNDESDVEGKSIVRPYLGIFAQKNLSEKTFLLGEAQLSFLGGNLFIKDGNGGYEVNSDFHSTQLNIPVSVNYSITPNASIHGGGYVGFVLSANEKTRTGKQEKFGIPYNSVDAGLLVGGSYKVSDKLSADVRYNFGLLPLYSEEYTTISNTTYQQQTAKVTASNRFIQLGISYYLK